MRAPPHAGQSLFELADAVGVLVPTSCHRNGKCRECAVEVVSGAEHLSPRSTAELGLEDGFRLACCARLETAEGHIACRTLERANLRITSSGDTGPRLDLASLDPAVTRDGDRVLLDGEFLADWSGPLSGLAIDLGTTTVVMRAVDLESGRTIATSAFENPQRFGGSDVLARIHYDGGHRGRALQRALLSQLGAVIQAMPLDPASIFEVLVVGNSTLRDLFFGLDVSTIGQRPYRSLTEHELLAGERTTTAVDVEARRLRLPIFPRARVQGLPLVSGHIGADAAACLLAVDIANETRPVALMDIGTNTELLVWTGERLFAASCPAGPAFEGGRISCGMPALDGAVERVRLDGDDVHLDVIGDGEPQGLCGSGLISALSELLRCGRINELGRSVDESERVVLCESPEISISEADISELAQAKGAHVAGLRITLARAGLDFGNIDRFYLAGGFAAHIDLEAGRRIGLLPDLDGGRMHCVGNAAIEGATLALLSRRRRAQLESLVRDAVHVELETDADFFEHFVEGCLLKRCSGSSASREETHRE